MIGRVEERIRSNYAPHQMHSYEYMKFDKGAMRNIRMKPFSGNRACLAMQKPATRPTKFRTTTSVRLMSDFYPDHYVGIVDVQD